MEHVSVLFKEEFIVLDHEKIKGLESSIGEKEAIAVMAKAMEAIAIRLAECELHLQDGQWKDLFKAAKFISRIAEGIGMGSLVKAARNVADAVTTGNTPAMAATAFRLIRVGDQSLSDFWDAQSVSSP